MLDVKDLRNYENLKKTIIEFVGFDCSQYTDPFLMRRIEVRLRATGIRSYREYSRVLRKSEEERKKLNKELTIHTTNFFRDKSLWEVLIKEAIPTLAGIKKENRSKTINVWSAGCSSGEEPLSIAICFYEALGKDLEGFNIKILATDRDKETIQRAQEAVYGKEQFREMPAGFKEKYFEKIDEEGFYVPKPIIKSSITYKVGDIILPIKPRNMDIIFCRNTVIYFDLKTKLELYDDFFRCLNKNGFFIMGKTEVLLGTTRECFQMFNEKERIYVKE